MLVAVGEEAARTQAKADAEQRKVQHRDDAARRADDEAFASAKSSGTVEAYGTYLDTYPSGQHVTQAQRLRSEAEAREAQSADDAAFVSAKSKGTAGAYGAYLDAYPSGEHSLEASRLRSEVERLARASIRQLRDCTGCPELVMVPAGSFMMGSPPGEEGRDGDEGPVHRVTIAQSFRGGGVRGDICPMGRMFTWRGMYAQT